MGDSWTDLTDLHFLVSGIAKEQHEPHRHERKLPGSWSAFVSTGLRQIFFQRIHSNTRVLQPPYSDVQVEVQGGEGLNGLLSCHVVRDDTPYYALFPDEECLLGPIVDCHFTPNGSRTAAEDGKPSFKLSIPHCLRTQEELKTVMVRHGDIRSKNKCPFLPVPDQRRASPDSPPADLCFKVNEKHVIIYTKHFSQFICTNGSCPQGKKQCRRRAEIFVFGTHSPPGFHPSASIRVRVCSPLYSILDKKKVSKGEQVVPLDNVSTLTSKIILIE